MGHFEVSGSGSLERDIDRIVVSADRIAATISELAREIEQCYRGKEVTILGILTGSLIFLSDLIRGLPLKIRLQMISASSYRGEAITPQELHFDLPERGELEAKHVLVVDNILDTGRTLEAILEDVRSLRPMSLKTCVLLRKNHREIEVPVVPDFCGFSIEPAFTVGYGLDFDGYYRNLPDICVLKPHVVSGESALSPTGDAQGRMGADPRAAPAKGTERQ